MNKTTQHKHWHTFFPPFPYTFQDDYIEDDEFDYVPDLPHLINSTTPRLQRQQQQANGSASTDPETFTTVADVPVSPFTVKKRARRSTSLSPPQSPGDVLMIVHDDPERRKFMNPISYLGGPLLEPRNRKSLDSMLSVDWQWDRMYRMQDINY